jgi:plastocyanin
MRNFSFFSSMSSATLWLILSFLVPGGLLAQCVVEGKVALPQTRSTPVMNKRYEIVTKGGVMSTNPPLAVVYLEGLFAKPVTPPVKQVIQKDFMFSPTLLPVQTGTKVEFPNLDDTYHNVFSFSPAKRFDLGRYRSDETPIPSQLLDKAGLITLRCDIHEHMRGIILVLDTPHFVVSEADGGFKLKNLPAGSYKLKAWISSRTTLEKNVILSSGSVLRVNFP